MKLKYLKLALESMINARSFLEENHEWQGKTGLDIPIYLFENEIIEEEDKQEES